MSGPAHAGGMLARKNKSVRSGPTPGPKPAARSADAMAALQRSAGNAAVTQSLVRRFGRAHAAFPAARNGAALRP